MKIITFKPFLLFLFFPVLVFSQEKKIRIESVSYVPQIIVNDAVYPWYQNVQMDVLCFSKLRLKLSQGLLSVSSGGYGDSWWASNSFNSKTAITHALDVEITPVRGNIFRFNVGCGLKYMHISEFYSYMQINEEVVINGESQLLPFQYFKVHKKSMLGVDIFVDFEFMLNKNISVELSLDAMNYKTDNNRDYGYISAGIGLTYYLVQ